jgi:hypothetical protein
VSKYTGDDFITTVAIPSAITLIGVPTAAMAAWQTGEPLWWLGVVGTAYGSIGGGLARWLLSVKKKEGV